MKKLTKGQRFALAREARRLAMECLTNGPKLANSWCGCAIGVSLKRAGLLPRRWDSQRDIGIAMERMLDADADMFGMRILSEATCERISRDNPTAVVIPLLAWADALEASAASVPQAPKEVP